MSYLISVVIPIYNAENFLKVCLESIFSQKTNSIEVILIDDGSINYIRSTHLLDIKHSLIHSLLLFEKLRLLQALLLH